MADNEIILTPEGRQKLVEENWEDEYEDEYEDENRGKHSFNIQILTPPFSILGTKNSFRQ